MTDCSAVTTSVCVGTMLVTDRDGSKDLVILGGGSGGTLDTKMVVSAKASSAGC